MTLTQRLTTYWWMAAGVVILIWPCLLEDWVDTTSTVNPFGRAPRTIDRWRSDWLGKVFNNPEDGVSGRYALVWNATGTDRVSYMPNAWAPWRAYCWNMRNSTDQLKYTYGKT